MECERSGVPRLDGAYEFALNVTQRECTLEKVEDMRAQLKRLGDEIDRNTTSLVWVPFVVRGAALFRTSPQPSVSTV